MPHLSRGENIKSEDGLKCHDYGDKHSHHDRDSDEEQEQELAAVADEPPNGGYGWVCVACAFLINCHTWGLNSASLSTLA